MWWYALALDSKGPPPSFEVRKGQAKVGWSPLRSLRRLRHSFWMGKGSKAFDLDDWETASKCHRKAVRARPNDLSAWEQWIFSEIMMGNEEATDRLIGEAHRFVNLRKPDVMMMRVYAAWFHKDTERTREYLEALANMDIKAAQAAAFQLMINPLNLDPPLWLVSTNDSQDSIDGYA